TPILTSAFAWLPARKPHRQRAMMRMLRLKVDMLIFRTSSNGWSKCLTDGKLKTLCFVVESHRVAGICIQRNPIRKTEQAQRCKPLHPDARRSLQSIIRKVIIDRRYIVQPQEMYLIAGLEDITHVVEPADTDGI